MKYIERTLTPDERSTLIDGPQGAPRIVVDSLAALGLMTKAGTLTEIGQHVRNREIADLLDRMFGPLSAPESVYPGLTLTRARLRP